MLLHSLYQIEAISLEENKLIASVFLNKIHPVFSGHFPENPILPGVCQIQLFEDALQFFTQETWVLDKILSSKFTAIIQPTLYPTLMLELNLTEVTKKSCCSQVVLSFEKTVFCKFKGIYKR